MSGMVGGREKNGAAAGLLSRQYHSGIAGYFKAVEVSGEKGGVTMVIINAKDVPKGDIDYLARSVLAEIEAFFDDPKVEEDFEKWKQEQKLVVAV